MTRFRFHTADTAPESARDTLRLVHKRMGFIPSLYAGLANSPTALKTYLTLSELIAGSSLSPLEQQVIALTASAENQCGFCMAAHSTIARQMMKVDDAIIDGLRNDEPLSDPRLQALRRFVTDVLRQRGYVRGNALERFLAAGFTHENVLDVIVGVSWKTLSNYANHVLQTPVDAEFVGELWEPATR